MNLSALIAQLIAVAKADAAKSILPLLANFFTSIAANPTAVNITVQLAQLQVGVLAALPAIGQDELKNLANVLNAEAQKILATPPATTTVTTP